MTKAELLSLSDDALKALCTCEARRGTGPGGQKRNKTSSAARVTHRESGISATDDQTRSQHQNLHNALRKLRLELAIALPSDGSLGAIPLEPVPNERAAAFPLWVALAYERLAAAGFQLAPAAEQYGSSPSHFSRVLARVPFLWQQLAQARQRCGLSPLH